MATVKHGVVTSAKMTGTVTVTVERSLFHPLYKKRYWRSATYLVDPTGHEVHVGDEVRIIECRPLSKRKHFRITEVVKKAPQVSDVVEEGTLQEVMHRTVTSSPTL